MVTCGSSQSSSSKDDTGLDDAERQAKKEAKQKRRKARNQRQYYHRYVTSILSCSLLNVLSQAYQGAAGQGLGKDIKVMFIAQNNTLC